MRLFQNVITYPNFRPLIAQRNKGVQSYRQCVSNFIDSCFINLHILKPVLDGSEEAFLAIGDLADVQRRWASEQGMPAKAGAADILLAQIEHHRAEVFYNWDPLRFDSGFVRRLPGHVKHSIAWHASPGPHLNFHAYDRVVCNFPSILADFERRGLKTGWFAPAHDPLMDGYAGAGARDVDVLFVGGYSRHHLKRIAVLEEVARANARWRVRYHLDTSLYGRLADSPLGILWPLRRLRRPAAIRDVAHPPLFGRDMYRALSQAKIVLNGAIDMAGGDRGNLRCWEAMGLGALLVSDAGHYPPGMEAGTTFLSYDSPSAAARAIETALEDGSWHDMTQRAAEMVRTRYSKTEQWRAFCNLL